MSIANDLESLAMRAGEPTTESSAETGVYIRYCNAMKDVSNQSAVAALDAFDRKISILRYETAQLKDEKAALQNRCDHLQTECEALQAECEALIANSLRNRWCRFCRKLVDGVSLDAPKSRSN